MPEDLLYIGPGVRFATKSRLNVTRVFWVDEDGNIWEGEVGQRVFVVEEDDRLDPETVNRKALAELQTEREREQGS